MGMHKRYPYGFVELPAGVYETETGFGILYPRRDSRFVAWCAYVCNNGFGVFSKKNSQIKKLTVYRFLHLKKYNICVII